VEFEFIEIEVYLFEKNAEKNIPSIFLGFSLFPFFALCSLLLP
jgi:hypothetical protein